MSNGGPNITKTVNIYDHSEERFRWRVSHLYVDNPPDGINPGKHEYIRIKRYYWSKKEETWLPAKQDLWIPITDPDAIFVMFHKVSEYLSKYWDRKEEAEDDQD